LDIVNVKPRESSGATNDVWDITGGCTTVVVVSDGSEPHAVKKTVVKNNMNIFTLVMVNFMGCLFIFKIYGIIQIN
jgi:hypothetical protein